MKRIFSLLITAIILIACVFSFSACSKCKHFESDEKYYAESNGIVTVYNKCKKCGGASDKVLETITVDAVVKDTDSNGVTVAQERANGDVTICLKKGNFGHIYLGSPTKKVKIICETGTTIQVAQLNGDSDGVTIENATFKSSLSEKTSEIKFETASGSSYWSNVKILNCHFEGKAYINSAWKGGIVENLTIENCTFKNISSSENRDSNLCAVFIGENWGETIVRNCTFDSVDYSALRFGYVSVEGDFLIENCYFRDIKRNRCIMFSGSNETIPGCDVTMTVKGCTFDDTSAISFNVSTAADKYVNAKLYVGVNTWREIPSSISGATEYDAREQIELD